MEDGSTAATPVLSTGLANNGERVVDSPHTQGSQAQTYIWLTIEVRELSRLLHDFRAQSASRMKLTTHL